MNKIKLMKIINYLYIANFIICYIAGILINKIFLIIAVLLAMIYAGYLLIILLKISKKLKRIKREMALLDLEYKQFKKSLTENKLRTIGIKRMNENKYKK